MRFLFNIGANLIEIASGDDGSYNVNKLCPQASIRSTSRQLSKLFVDVQLDLVRIRLAPNLNNSKIAIRLVYILIKNF